MKTLTQIIQHKLLKETCVYYLVLMLLVQQTQGSQSAFSYKTNQLPFSYNAQTGLNHVPVHPYQQPQAQVQQQAYLTLPFLQNYAGNLRKKPTKSSTFIFNKSTKHKHHAINSNTNANHHHSNSNNNNNINMHMYSKRYKRYPPFQTMPEIPIKKAIGRYLPYAPIYPMGVMTPSILLPLYVAPAKATARIILKPSVVDLASTSAAKLKQTKLNKSLLLNYLRLTSDKKNLNKSLTTNTTAMPTSITTTTSTASTTIGNYVVDSHIKFYDTPYSASNIQQQQQQQLKQHYYNNLYNNNYATHFLLPVMPPKTTTTTAATSTEDSFKRMPASFYERGQIVNDKGDYEFLPTWYSYGKQQPKKYSNFFTIEDAITPYKPIEPLTIGYQPPYFYESTQTESYAHIKPTNYTHMQFSPIYATDDNITTTTSTATTTMNTNTTTSTTTSSKSSTASSFLEELSREASKWNLFSNEKDDTTTTTKQLVSTVGTLKIEEISLTSSAPHITTRNMSKLERALKMAENVEPYRIRSSTTAATNISPTKSIKKVLRTKSFFDDWFADTNSDESVETTTQVEKILPTTPLTEMDDRYHKLKWPTKRRNQNINRTTTSTTTPPTTMNATRGILKKPRKKYGNPKPNKLNRNFTSKENTELKTNGTTKFVKRIKKVLRVRPTLFSILKLQNKNIDEQIDRPLQGMDMTPTQIIQNSMEDNEQVTFAPKMVTTTTTTTVPTSILIQSTTSTTTTTTSMTSTANKTVTDNAERTRFGGLQRKRGRHSYNSQMNQSTTASTFINSERQERIEANKKSRQTHGRQRSTTTTTTKSTTTTTTNEPKNHRNELEILPVLKNHRDGSSTTMESAIMKIARNKRINNILENLLVTSSTSSTPLSDGLTEYPQLPIELYFQKIKAGFK